MLEKESYNQIDNENIQQPNEPKINIYEIKSFENLFNLFKSEKYMTNQFSGDLQNFCRESEKNNYVCEKNKEFKIPSNDKTLFEKFYLSKNRFDFQIYMSDLLIEYFKYLIHFKATNKKEYNMKKNIFQLFTEIKNSGLLMEDIQCINEYGLLKDYNNNFFLFLFDINDKDIKQLFIFFDLKKYFLSNINNINTFIFRFNELIVSSQNDVKQFMPLNKIETILSETLNLFNSNTENDNYEKSENNHKMEKYKNKIINSICKEKIFELFFKDEQFTSHLTTLLHLFTIFTEEIDKQIKVLFSINDKQIKKTISKFVIKHASFLDNYISKETLFIINDFSIENCFSFYIKEYMEGKSRLINIYNIFKDNKKCINNLVNILRNKLKKDKQAELIEKYKYNEQDEYELEEKQNIDNNNNIYFFLPDNYKIFYISCEDENHIKESKNILDNLINTNACLDEYLGIDTEWKSSNTFLDLYTNNLTDSNKNNDIIIKDHNELSDIIQIAGCNYGFIFDTKSIYKNEEIMNKIEKIFYKSKFIGFSFQNDSIKLGDFFKKIVYKNELIELSNIYMKIKKKKAPELKIITKEMFNKVLDKRDQISDWSKRPLLPSQIKYGILDAYILILIYKNLYEINY